MTSEKPGEKNIHDLLRKAQEPARIAEKLHAYYRGKMSTLPKCAIRDVDDFSIWYTPGVAAPCRSIQENPDSVYSLTNKGNTIAVISDGSRVLGLGNIGPEAGLPVMEGKCLLFKYLGGVDAVPIMLDIETPEDFIETVLRLQPSFGGINLEDISQPKCFTILEELREKAHIPVWHDDQQGTATVTLAGLMNALKVVGKKKENVRIAWLAPALSSPGVWNQPKPALWTQAASWENIEKISQKAPPPGAYARSPTLKDCRVASRKRYRVRMWSSLIQPPDPGSSCQNGSKVWLRTPSCSPAPTPCLKSGPGKLRQRARPWSPPGARTSPIRSTTPSPSQVSSAVYWTCAPRPFRTRCASLPRRRWRKPQPKISMKTISYQR